MINGRDNQVVRHIYSAIFLVMLLYLFIRSYHLLSPILLSFFLVILISLALNPFISRLRKRIGGRTQATGALVLAFFALAALIAWGFYSPLKRSTGKFLDRLPDYWTRIQKPILRMEQKAVLSEQRLKMEVSREVSPQHLSTNAPALTTPQTEKAPIYSTQHAPIGQLFTVLSGGFQSLALNAAAMLLVAVTVFVGVIFTLVNPRAILATIFSIIPARNHLKASVVARRIVLFVPRWASATLMGMFIIGLLVLFCMWPIFGFQDALVLGMIAMVFEAVPYVGPVISGIPALLLAIGEGGWLPLWVIAAYLAIQLIEHNIIAPLIVAGRLQLNPVGVIFSVLLCVAAFGILGVIVAVPALEIAKILHEEIYRKRYLPEVSNAELEMLARRILEGETDRAEGKIVSVAPIELNRKASGEAG
ncbi:MAG: family transporter [Verrucomicrobiales bacterium]|nr:family transporter [Verrucomicrobiales bacterium]